MLGQDRIQHTYTNWLSHKNHGIKFIIRHHENKGRPKIKTNEDKDALIKKQREN